MHPGYGDFFYDPVPPFMPWGQPRWYLNRPCLFRTPCYRAGYPSRAGYVSNPSGTEHTESQPFSSGSHYQPSSPDSGSKDNGALPELNPGNKQYTNNPSGFETNGQPGSVSADKTQNSYSAGQSYPSSSGCSYGPSEDPTTVPPQASETTPGGCGSQPNGETLELFFFKLNYIVCQNFFHFAADY